MKAKATLYALIGLTCVSACLYVVLRAAPVVYRFLELEPLPPAQEMISGLCIIIFGISLSLVLIAAAYELGKYIMEKLL